MDFPDRDEHVNGEDRGREGREEAERECEPTEELAPRRRVRPEAWWAEAHALRGADPVDEPRSAEGAHDLLRAVANEHQAGDDS